MGSKLYVGNLSYSVGEQELTEMFLQFGTVESAKIITDRDSGRSKGFAFVEMSSEDEAEKAIQALNGSTHQGRPLTVNKARPQEPRHGGGGRRGGGSGYRDRGDRGDRGGRSGGYGGGDRY